PASRRRHRGTATVSGKPWGAASRGAALLATMARVAATASVAPTSARANDVIMGNSFLLPGAGESAHVLGHAGIVPTCYLFVFISVYWGITILRDSHLVNSGQ
ncbi:MAG: hypothetical protein ACRCUI_10205, partial [Polymorphobacter sp.]